MPSAPELRNAAGTVGVVKILLQLEAEHPPKADSHIGIAAEIIVNLKGVGKRPHPCGQNGHRRKACNRFINSSQIIGQQHLFSQAPDKIADALPEFIHGGLAFPKLGVNIRVLNNRPCHQLREHGNIQSEGKDIPLIPGPSPVYVDKIGEGLKGIKG